MNVQTKHPTFTIKGFTHQGKPFRPRNWAERLCNCFVTFGPWRNPSYSPYVYINFSQEGESLVVEDKLWENNPRGYQFLESFARDNNLRTVEGNNLMGERVEMSSC
jgi:hypothetical protein